MEGIGAQLKFGARVGASSARAAERNLGGVLSADACRSIDTPTARAQACLRPERVLIAGGYAASGFGNAFAQIRQGAWKPPSDELWFAREIVAQARKISATLAKDDRPSNQAKANEPGGVVDENVSGSDSGSR